MNSEVVKKSKAEKALFKVHRNKYNEAKRKLDPNYTRRNGMHGLICKSFLDLPIILKVAEAIELGYAE